MHVNESEIHLFFYRLYFNMKTKDVLLIDETLKDDLILSLTNTLE